MMNRPHCILGAGASGWAAARLLQGPGRICSETDPGEAARARFAELGFLWDSRGPDRNGGTVIASPGFAEDHPWILRCAEQGLELLPEFELGAARLRGKILAVTGSLGKTTTVMLAAELLRAHGLRVTLSGNIGTPVCETARTCPEADWHVLELSSFQTALLRRFRPDVGILLNLFPNHLDRHGTLEAYARAKARLFALQTADDLAVLPADFPVAVESRARRVIPEAANLPDLGGTCFDSPAGRANLAALFSGLADLPLDAERVRRVLERFQPPPHRMQEIRIPGAGRIVDDSKSTCLSATRAALAGIPGPVHLLAGGLHKGDDPALLLPELERGGRSVYLFGASAGLFAEAWRDRGFPVSQSRTLPEALALVFSRRKPEEPLLFSPGCASFDQFSSYTERGQRFQHFVFEHYTQTCQSTTAEPPSKETP